MSSATKAPTVRGQWLTCGLLSGLAAVIVLVGHPVPAVAALVVGLPLWQQLAISFGFAVCAAGAALLALGVPRLRRAIPVPAAMRAFDLSGTTPLQIGLAAGIGEELLFRGALQPLVGMWWASAIFAAAHIRTAMYADGTIKKIAYIANVFVAGVALGLVYRYTGLFAAILIHATVDVASLALLHRLGAMDAAKAA